MGIITYALGQVVSLYVESEFMLLAIKIIIAGIIIIITLLVIPKNWLGEIPKYITQFLYSKFPKIETFVRKIYRHNGDKASV
jgi:amino acid permease